MILVWHLGGLESNSLVSQLGGQCLLSGIKKQIRTEKFVLPRQ